MANKHSITAIEKSVLRQIDLDARMPFSKAAKKIHKSQQIVSYAVNSLINKNIIKGFYTVIDFSKLDVLSFRVYFKVMYIGEGKFHELIEYVNKIQHISWVATLGGRYDLLCSFLASNPSQFNKVLRQIMERFPQQLKDYTVLTTIVIRRFGRKYLYNDPSNFRETIVGGDRMPEEINKEDLKILNEIANNARESSVKIGNDIELTPKTIISRIKRLQKRGIIKGFKPLVDVKQIGYISKIIVIRYHNLSSELEDKFILYLKSHPNVVNIVKTLGEWDIEIEVETENQAESRKVEMAIREKFALLIQYIESFSLYRSFKRNFFPRFLID